MTTPRQSLNLTTKPETVTWPETHYVYIEKIGPFQNTKEKGPGTLIRGWKVLPPARVSLTPPLSLPPLNSFQ